MAEATTKVNPERAVCDDKCGCPSPCPGGTACRYTGVGPTRGGGEAASEHKTCRCGEHCGCNPCSCPKSVTGAAKASCKCGPGCSCSTCGAAAAAS